jgi:5-methylcytosine-specific restriction protein A
MTRPFIQNRLYNRRDDIHAVYGGQRQSGIVTPKNAPMIFLFTSHGASKVGYGDRWEPDGSIWYTGEGQTGSMQMKGGNKAIRDHVASGRDLLLFQATGHGKPVKFVGQFILAAWKTEQQLGADDLMREAIVFQLVPLDAADIPPEPSYGDEVGESLVSDLETLRQRAYEAAAPATVSGSASRTVYRRSQAVRQYVLARAGGQCEACQAPAPFMTAKGEPYLEPHHILRVSDGGPDDPKHVAAVCPNCHRAAHLGTEARTLKEKMLRVVAALEA